MFHKKNVSVLKKFARLDFLALEQMHQVLGKGFLHFRGVCTVHGDPGAAGCSENHGYPNLPNSLMVKLAVQGTPCAWHMLGNKRMTRSHVLFPVLQDCGEILEAQN